MAAAVKEGRFVWVSPVGYINTKSGRGSIIKPDPERALLVRKGFELMATGRYSADDALRQINALGLTNKKGRPVPRQTWHAMLKNPLYAGWVKSGNQMVVGLHEALISQKMFDKVQEVLKENSRGNDSRLAMRAEFPLKQFVRCAKCEKGLTAGLAKRKFPYYWCYTKSCHDVHVPKDQLEKSFGLLLGTFQPTIEYLNMASEVAAKQKEVRGEAIQYELRELTKRKDEQKRLNSQAIKANLLGKLSAENFETLQQEINEEIQKIDRAISAVESERTTLEEASRQSKLEDISLASTWQNALVEGKIELQKALFSGGLHWSHENGFLNRKNKWLMESFLQFYEQVTNGPTDAQTFAVRFGVPDGI